MCLIGAQPAQAIQGGSDVPQADARFDAACGVIRTSFLTPGSCSDCYSINGSGTLIAPDLVLTARHIFGTMPPVPHSVRFRVNESGSYGQRDTSLPDDGWSSFYHVAVVEWWFPTGTDLALGRLEHCVTHIEPIPVKFIDSPDLAVDTPLKIAGWGFQGCGLTPISQFPTHRLKVCCNAVVQPMSPLFLSWYFACDELNPCEDETYDTGGPRNFDSGAPALLATSCGDFELVAVTQSTLGGPVENLAGFPIHVYRSSCPADLNNDQVVDGLDLAILLGNWDGVGTTNGDLDCSLIIDGEDLAILLAAWGACPDPCGEGAAPSGGGGGGAESPQSTSDDDAFHQWALQATLEELFHWLETGCWGESGS